MLFQFLSRGFNVDLIKSVVVLFVTLSKVKQLLLLASQQELVLEFDDVVLNVEVSSAAVILIPK
jgi:uncharacterized membrane protein